MLTVLDLFSGIGGMSFGLESTGGFRTVAFCEIDPFCREVLRKHWPTVPVHEDVRSLAARSVGRPVDVISGGFPCQPHSVAGKRKGREDERHLWPEFARLVREIRPRWVLAENVPGIRTTAADEVLADLEAAGYSCWPLVVGADDVGAPHRRKRVWFVAHRVGSALREQPGRGGGASGAGSAEPRGDGTGELADSDGGQYHIGEGEEWAAHVGSVEGWLPVWLAGHGWPARPGEPQHEWEEPRLAYAGAGNRDGRTREPGREPEERAAAGRDGTAGDEEPRRAELPLGSPAHGLPERLVRRANRETLKATGNAVVPAVVAAIGRAILEAEAMIR